MTDKPLMSREDALQFRKIFQDTGVELSESGDIRLTHEFEFVKERAELLVESYVRLLNERDRRLS